MTEPSYTNQGQNDQLAQRILLHAKYRSVKWNVWLGSVPSFLGRFVRTNARILLFYLHQMNNWFRSGRNTKNIKYLGTYNKSHIRKLIIFYINRGSLNSVDSLESSFIFSCKIFNFIIKIVCYYEIVQFFPHALSIYIYSNSVVSDNVLW